MEAHLCCFAAVSHAFHVLFFCRLIFVKVLILLFILKSINLFFFFFYKGSFDVSDREIYEIDYRGPKTHSSIPPPDNSHRRQRSVHREIGILSPHKPFKSLKGGIGKK